MHEGERILSDALARSAVREAARVPIDYAAMNKMIKRQRAALTRAVNAKDANKVLVACKAAVAEWNKPGAAWPDDWSRWQRALDDVLYRQGKRVALEDLA